MSTRTTLLLLIVFGVVLYELQWILVPFVISGLLAYVSTPAIGWLSPRLRLPRSAVAIMFFLLIVGLGCLLGFMGLPPLINAMKGILTDFQGTIQELAKRLIGSGTVNLFGQPMNAAQMASAAAAAIREWAGQPARLAVLGGTAFAGVFGVFLSLVLLFYFLVSGPQLLWGLLSIVPPGQRGLVLHIWSQVDPILKRYFVGVIGVVIYAAVAAYIGLGIALGITHAAFLALITGILELIPIVGPGAAAVLAGLVALHQAKSIGAIIGFAVYAAALRLSIDQFLGPIALGAAARVHPVLIIFCFLTGALLFGIIGVILAVPVALVARHTLSILYDEPSARAAKS